MKKKKEKYRKANGTEVFIGNGPIKRLNPDMPWNEIPQDIKDVIRTEEKKDRPIHDDLQKRIEEIEGTTNNGN